MRGKIFKGALRRSLKSRSGGCTYRGKDKIHVCARRVADTRKTLQQRNANTFFGSRQAAPAFA